MVVWTKILLTVFRSPPHGCIFFRYDHSNTDVLKRVTVEEDLSDQWSHVEDLFDLLGSDVFALGQFEDILRSINDLD